MKKIFTSIALLLVAGAMFAQVSVTFNVDMTDATAFKAGDPIFDPIVTFSAALHDVYIAGSGFGNDWKEPGTDATLKMTHTSGNFYSITFPSVAAGNLAFKYFFIPNGAAVHSWNGGEWTGDPNRRLVVGTSPIIFDGDWAVNVAPFPATVNNLNTSNVSIYPNPSNGLFNVKVEQNCKLNVIDIAGKSIFQGELSNAVNTVDLSKVQAGMYFFKISSENNSSIQRVIIK
jgi:hypothetical protein